MLNKKDLIILSKFRKDGRKSLTKISRETNIPVSTLFDKLKKFEGNIIKKHTALLDFQKLGFDLRVNMIIKVDKEDKDKLQEFLIKNERINSVFKINNGDFLIEGIFVNMKDMQSFTELLERFKIEKRDEFYILDDLKKEGFMADADLIFGE